MKKDDLLGRARRFQGGPSAWVDWRLGRDSETNETESPAHGGKMKLKTGTKVKHYDTGIWRQGVFEGISASKGMGLVLFDDAPTLGGEPVTELVRLDELEEVKEVQ